MTGTGFYVQTEAYPVAALKELHPNVKWSLVVMGTDRTLSEINSVISHYNAGGLPPYLLTHSLPEAETAHSKWPKIPQVCWNEPELGTIPNQCPAAGCQMPLTPSQRLVVEHKLLAMGIKALGPNTCSPGSVQGATYIKEYKALGGIVSAVHGYKDGGTMTASEVMGLAMQCAVTEWTYPSLEDAATVIKSGLPIAVFEAGDFFDQVSGDWQTNAKYNKLHALLAATT